MTIWQGEVKDELDREAAWHWIKAGTNPVYCAVADGRVAAVVYETAEEFGADEDGQPIVTAPGWFWFASEYSSEHHAVEFAAPLAEDERGSLDPQHDAALGAVGEAVDAYIREGQYP
jgi:hypothetical protein